MNQYLRNLNRLEFMVTDACTGNCKHCSQGRHADYNACCISKEVAGKTVREVAGRYKLSSVMTFGGEPLLFPETVFTIHSEAKKMNVNKRQLITNGFFSKSSARINQVARDLLQCGVNEILLSVDAFHQEYIPLEPVKEFAFAVKNQGIKVHAHPAWLVGKEHNNPYNSKTKELLVVFEKMGIGSSSGNNIFIEGNARKYLMEYYELSRLNECPYIENPEDIRSICVAANGNVLDGNVNETDILEILNNYGKQEVSKTIAKQER